MLVEGFSPTQGPIATQAACWTKKARLRSRRKARHEGRNTHALNTELVRRGCSNNLDQLNLFGWDHAREAREATQTSRARACATRAYGRPRGTRAAAQERRHSRRGPHNTAAGQSKQRKYVHSTQQQQDSKKKTQATFRAQGALSPIKLHSVR